MCDPPCLHKLWMLSISKSRTKSGNCHVHCEKAPAVSDSPQKRDRVVTRNFTPPCFSPLLQTLPQIGRGTVVLCAASSRSWAVQQLWLSYHRPQQTQTERCFSPCESFSESNSQYVVVVFFCLFVCFDLFCFLRLKQSHDFSCKW